MEENKFFKWLWRINAIGLFLILCAGLFSFINEQIRRSHRLDIPPEPISSLAEDPKGVEKWVLQSREEMLGTPYFMLALVSKYNKVKAKDKSYYATTNNLAYYHQNVAKNILFINSENSKASWMFKTNNQLIVQYESLLNNSRTPYYVQVERKESKAKLIYYKIIDRDTNGDKIITMEDKQSFAVSKVSGKGYKVIVRNIESIINMKYNKNNEMYLVYQKEGMGYMLRLNIETLEVIDNIVLPKVGTKK